MTAAAPAARGAPAARTTEAYLDPNPAENAADNDRPTQVGRGRTREGRWSPGDTHPVIAGRYELVDVVGSGGAGEVYEAKDLVAGRRVALKLITSLPHGAPPRVRREVAALRLLRIPGVVALLDEGTWDGYPFLVMDLVDGKPFPGGAPAGDWDAIAPLAMTLVETLTRVHAAGVVHRDLKPSNVLVDAQGRVTLVDFGLSWGPALGAAVTAVGTVVGTLEYVAPEQFLGGGGDVRTDLYALGVMLYEVLTGRYPHDAIDLLELMQRKRNEVPVSVRHLAPATPREVAQTIDRLLAIDPEDRPQSAGELQRLLFGEGAPRAREPLLPRLGDRAPLERVVAAAAALRSIDVCGAPGTGRTRLLADAADALGTQGRRVRWIVPSPDPFESLSDLVGGFDDLGDAGPEEAAASIRARLEAVLRAGTVVVADDAERLDRWSAATLDAARGAGCVVRVVAAPTGDFVRLTELAESDLRALFDGPDRIFHLREDGARELWRRTGGLQSRIAAEISAWVRAGLATAGADGRIVVTREALNRLSGGVLAGDELLLSSVRGRAPPPALDELLGWVAMAWPHATPDVLARAAGRPRWRLEPELDALAQGGYARRLDDGRVQPLVMPSSLQTWSDERRRRAHRALGDALPPGAPMRLRHLTAAGEPEQVADEALVLAPRLAEEGSAGEALVVLDLGLAAARHASARDRELRILEQFAKACLSEATPAAIQRALYEASRSGRETPEVAALIELLAAARDASTGTPADVLARLARTGPFDDLDLELWRQGQRVRVARRLPPEESARILDEIEEWAWRRGGVREQASVVAWRALQLDTQGRSQEAAHLHLEAARGAGRPSFRLAAQLNAAFSLLAVGDLAGARDAATAARDEAIRGRNASIEAFAESALRSISYRMGDSGPPDAELCDAVRTTGEPQLEGLVCLTEAAVAWRSGDLATARALAARSVKAYRSSFSDVTSGPARALEILCGGAAEPGEIERMSADAAVAADAEVAIQTLGLLALAVPSQAAAYRALAARRAPELRNDPDARLDVISVREATVGVTAVAGANLRS